MAGRFAVPPRRCFVLGCASDHLARGFCNNHYKLTRNNGSPLGATRRHITGDGYWAVAASQVPPFVSDGLVRKDRAILEHRLVMSEALGRPVRDHETVHHRNGRREDNRLSNLELRVGQHGKGATHHCQTCTCGG